MDLYKVFFRPLRFRFFSQVLTFWGVHQLSFLLLFDTELQNIQNIKTTYQQFRKGRRDVSMHVMSYYYFFIIKKGFFIILRIKTLLKNKNKNKLRLNIVYFATQNAITLFQ